MKECPSLVYRANIFRFLFSMDDHLFRIREAEEFKNIRKINLILVLCSIAIYGWMSYLGIGTDILSSNIYNYQASEFELNKFWFIIGRLIYGAFFAIFILFIVPFIIFGITEIPIQKLRMMQQIVLTVLLVERVIWIPLYVYLGLDWDVSPFSFGIIASYLVEVPWIISFFGAISLFQIWIIWFQVKFIKSLTSLKIQSIWISILLLHIFYWLIASLFVFIDISFLSRWFG